MDKLWNQQGSLNLPLWSWLELRSASEGSDSRANEVATSTSLVGLRVCFLTTQSHHRYSLKPATHQEPQMEPVH